MSNSSKIRVIAGSARGRKVIVPDGIPDLRPTRDRVRESLFNILGPEIQGARFLDLYAGTGVNGIEALSRGAAHATFVDKDRRATEAIAVHLDLFGLADRAQVVRGALPNVLGQVADCYDLIFADPPYADTDVQPLLSGIRDRNLLAANGTLILETDSKASVDSGSDSWSPDRIEHYGQTALQFYHV